MKTFLIEPKVKLKINIGSASTIHGGFGKPYESHFLFISPKIKIMDNIIIVFKSMTLLF